MIPAYHLCLEAYGLIAWHIMALAAEGFMPPALSVLNNPCPTPYLSMEVELCDRRAGYWTSGNLIFLHCSAAESWPFTGPLQFLPRNFSATL